MNITVNFLLQATRILHIGNYTEEELKSIYNFSINIDNEVLFHYLNSKTVLSYDTDLELFIEILDGLIRIYEETEDYEKCNLLKLRKEESIKILNS